MKLNERFDWVEEDLGERQSERITIIERELVTIDWLVVTVAFLFGAISMSILVLCVGGVRW